MRNCGLQEAIAAGQLAQEEWKAEISEMQDKLQTEIATTTQLLHDAYVEKIVTEQRCTLGLLGWQQTPKLLGTFLDFWSSATLSLYLCTP